MAPPAHTSRRCNRKVVKSLHEECLQSVTRQWRSRCDRKVRHNEVFETCVCRFDTDEFRAIWFNLAGMVLFNVVCRPIEHEYDATRHVSTYQRQSNNEEVAKSELKLLGEY